jgi:hypothetical protein
VQVRDAVLAAEEDRLDVDLLHAVPHVGLRLEHGRVLGRGDARVVEEHVDRVVRGAHGVEHADDGVLVCHVAAQRQVGAGEVVAQVDAGHRGALRLEAADGLRADSARGARDDAHLPVETPHQVPVA